MLKKNGIFQEERFEVILDLIASNGRVLIDDLSKKFNTTKVTIRRDLALLEKRGLLKRTHGGAIKNKSLFQGLALNEKEKLNLNEKKRIAKKAASMIFEGDTIILDSGSTTTLLAKEIKNMKSITVITNAVNIASELAHSEIEIILTGGSFQKDSYTLIGTFADEILRKISADKLFQGVDGIDFEIGLTTPSITEAKTSKVMMSRVNEVIIVADSSKFWRKSLAVISEINEVDKIVTTKKLTKKELKKFKDLDVEIITA